MTTEPTGAPIPTTTYPESPSITWDEADLEAAIERATAFLARSPQDIDPVSLGISSYLGRNWGIPELERARDLALAAGRPNGWAGINWRVVDPTAAPRTVRGREAHDELLLGRALYCDREAPRPGYVDQLKRFAARDDFGLTHAALATRWLAELGCQVRGADQLERALTQRLAARVRRERSVTDTTLCFSARLVYAGRSDAIPRTWVGRILGAQRPDGSWPSEPTRPDQSKWHATLLALWTLLGVDRPGNEVPVVPDGRVAPAVTLP